MLALLKAQVSLQLGKIFSSDNGVAVYIMYCMISLYLIICVSAL